MYVTVYSVVILMIGTSIIIQLKDIINCKLMMSDINVVDCDDSNCCFCNNHNCSVNVQIQRQYLFVTVLVLPLMLLLTCILLACFHITRRKAIRPADLIPDFEVCIFARLHASFIPKCMFIV